RGAGLELLQCAPGLADDLARVLGAEHALAGGLRRQDVEPVVVEDRTLGSGRHDDEVAVPGLELLEHGQQLLALRAALRAAEALVSFALREVELLELTLGLLARLVAALRDAREDRLRRSVRLELRIEVDRAGDLEQRLASLCRLGVEQARDAVEPPARDARERDDLLGREARRPARDLVVHGLLRQAAKRDELTSG